MRRLLFDQFINAEYLFYIQLRKSEEFEMFDETTEQRDIMVSDGITYTFHPKASSQVRTATTMLGAKLVEAGGTDKISVFVSVTFPSMTDLSTCTSERFPFSVNLKDEDEGAVSEAFEECFDMIKSSGEPLIAEYLYNKNDAYFMVVPITSEIASEEDCVRYCVWTQDENAKEICRALMETANDIWMTFLGNPSIQ